MAGNGRSDDKVEVAHVSGFAALAAQVRAHRLAGNGQDGEGGSGGDRAGNASVEGAVTDGTAPDGAAPDGAAPDGTAPDIFATVTEHAPMPQKTCAVCAARNDAGRDSCWNCGASLRRVR